MIDHERQHLSLGVIVGCAFSSFCYLGVLIASSRRLAAHSDLNSSAKGFFWSIIGVSLLLFAICVLQMAVYRRASAAVGVIGSSIFGVGICLLFVGV